MQFLTQSSGKTPILCFWKARIFSFRSLKYKSGASQWKWLSHDKVNFVCRLMNIIYRNKCFFQLSSYESNSPKSNWQEPFWSGIFSSPELLCLKFNQLNLPQTCRTPRYRILFVFLSLTQSTAYVCGIPKEDIFLPDQIHVGLQMKQMHWEGRLN